MMQRNVITYGWGKWWEFHLHGSNNKQEAKNFQIICNIEQLHIFDTCRMYYHLFLSIYCLQNLNLSDLFAGAFR